ncbi:hypothetical protein [Streptomyces noursei]|uniref:hypothetical protein n=1 Tax=Streptomyces noursei TaxID=1971 RepID=UPI0030F1FB35
MPLIKVGPPVTLLTRPTAGLSGGEAQCLCLVRALAVRPERSVAEATGGDLV